MSAVMTGGAAQALRTGFPARSSLTEFERALMGGERHWAEALGGSLISAGERNERRQDVSLELDHEAAPDSPRFFVSWLMTWSV